PSVNRADVLEDFQPGLVWQTEVEQNDVRRLESDAFDPFAARGRVLHVVLRPREDVPDLGGYDFEIVINEKQVGHRAITPMGIPDSFIASRSIVEVPRNLSRSFLTLSAK